MKPDKHWFPLSRLGGRNRRGEALPSTIANIQTRIPARAVEASGNPDAEPKWYVLWTRSNFEQLVHEQLAGKGFDSFLPMLTRWSRRKGVRYLTRIPMFASYLFLRHPNIDKESYIEVCKTKGLVRILGERWDRLGTVPHREMEAIRKVVEADLPALPHSYLRRGQHVRVVAGPLANVEGILVESEPEKGLLILSIDLLQRSIGVQIDCTLVRPV